MEKRIKNGAKCEAERETPFFNFWEKLKLKVREKEEEEEGGERSESEWGGRSSGSGSMKGHSSLRPSTSAPSSSSLCFRANSWLLILSLSAF